MKIVPRRWSWGDGDSTSEKTDNSHQRPVVWLSRRIENPELQQDLLMLLSPDERARHERLRRTEDQQRFLTGRGLLRMVAGEHLNIPAERVVFAYGRFGKPSLARTQSGAPLHFNISHSGDLVLLAFSLTHEIGVDIEQLRPEEEWREVAAQIFPAAQYAEWLRLDEPARAELFFQTWTRKEAALKATGSGLAGNQGSGSSDRQLFDLDLPPGYAGALATVVPGFAPDATKFTSVTYR